MKTTLLSILLIAAFLSQGQVMTDFKITPQNPTTEDSISISFTLVFPWAGAKKQKSILTYVNDTIIYNGCYFRPGFAQSDSYIYDSCSTMPLPAGHYSILIMRDFVHYYNDTTCMNIVFSDTLDTLVVVAEPSVIHKPATAPWQAIMLPGNRLQVYSQVSGNMQLELYSANGRLVYKRDEEVTRGTNTIPLSGATLPAGLYVCRLNMNGDATVIKFVR